jgi:hypothetical protein
LKLTWSTAVKWPNRLVSFSQSIMISRATGIKVRNPKLEIRSKFESENSKSQSSDRPLGRNQGCFALRFSSFLRVSIFEFRISLRHVGECHIGRHSSAKFAFAIV